MTSGPTVKEVLATRDSILQFMRREEENMSQVPIDSAVQEFPRGHPFIVKDMPKGKQTLRSIIQQAKAGQARNAELYSREREAIEEARAEARMRDQCEVADESYQKFLKLVEDIRRTATSLEYVANRSAMKSSHEVFQEEYGRVPTDNVEERYREITRARWEKHESTTLAKSTEMLKVEPPLAQALGMRTRSARQASLGEEVALAQTALGEILDAQEQDRKVLAEMELQRNDCKSKMKAKDEEQAARRAELIELLQAVATKLPEFQKGCLEIKLWKQLLLGLESSFALAEQEIEEAEPEGRLATEECQRWHDDAKAKEATIQAARGAAAQEIAKLSPDVVRTEFLKVRVGSELCGKVLQDQELAIDDLENCKATLDRKIDRLSTEPPPEGRSIISINSALAETKAHSAECARKIKSCKSRKADLLATQSRAEELCKTFKDFGSEALEGVEEDTVERAKDHANRAYGEFKCFESSCLAIQDQSPQPPAPEEAAGEAAPAVVRANELVKALFSEPAAPLVKEMMQACSAPLMKQMQAEMLPMMMAMWQKASGQSSSSASSVPCSPAPDAREALGSAGHNLPEFHDMTSASDVGSEAGTSTDGGASLNWYRV